MESREASDLTNNASESHEPKILRRKSANNKVPKRVTFDPDSTLLPSYTKKPVTDSNGESSTIIIRYFLAFFCCF